MKYEDLDAQEIIKNAQTILAEDITLSNPCRCAFESLTLLATTLLNQASLNSSNSGKPPSSDPNRLKKKNTNLDRYRFILLTDNSQVIEPQTIYLSLKNGMINYQCLDLNNNITYGTINPNEFPAGVQFPEDNTIESFNNVKRAILNITATRGHTETLKKPGGQPGHKGVTLQPVENPDEIIHLSIDRRTLPNNVELTLSGHVARQVINLRISTHVVEYRSEILVDIFGNEYVADFPKDVTRPIQYGSSVKSHSCYLSVYQLIPYNRINDQFNNEYKIPISPGTIYNFNAEAANNLRKLNFEQIVKEKLISSPVDHSDETSINVNGKKKWLHVCSNDLWTWFELHDKRGCKAMDDINILPDFTGTLCHDHWKPYYTYKCKHSLCNAHHLRELTRAYEQDGQTWALKMHNFLLDVRKEVEKTEVQHLPIDVVNERLLEFRTIIANGEIECPEIIPKPGTKRKPKQTKSRNLLTRLRDFEEDVLKFLSDPLVPFSNNLGERDIRMTKVHQKISGCFRSLEGAINFYLIRSYISTCEKNGVTATEALDMLFSKKLPAFIYN